MGPNQGFLLELESHESTAFYLISLSHFSPASAFPGLLNSHLLRTHRLYTILPSPLSLLRHGACEMLRFIGITDIGSQLEGPGDPSGDQESDLSGSSGAHETITFS